MLQVFTNLRRVTKKSSKLSTGCCVRRRRMCHSTDSFTWPLMWRLIAVIMASASFFCSVVRLRLFTIVRVSLDKHRANTCTLVSANSPLNPDRVVYDVHWAFQASKSAPQPTCMFSLGRSVCQNTYGILCCIYR